MASRSSPSSETTAVGVHAVVGFLDAAHQFVHGDGLQMLAVLERVDSHRRRDLATLMPAHPIGDDIDARAEQHRVLVDGPQLPGVARAAGAEEDGHATSITVEPIWIWSPRLTTMGAATLRRLR